MSEDPHIQSEESGTEADSYDEHEDSQSLILELPEFKKQDESQWKHPFPKLAWDGSFLDDLSEYPFMMLKKVSILRYYQLGNEIVIIQPYTPLQCVIDECKTLFTTAKLGTHWFRHNRGTYTMIRVFRVSENKVYRERPISKDTNQTQLRKAILFRYIMGLPISYSCFLVRFNGETETVVSWKQEKDISLSYHQVKIQKKLISACFDGKSITDFITMLFKQDQIRSLEDQIRNVIQRVDPAQCAIIHTIKSRMISAC